MKPGDRVSDRYGETGTVFRLHDDFTAAASSFLTMTPEQWLGQQLIPFTEVQQGEMWASVAVDGGGSIISPLSLLEPS